MNEEALLARIAELEAENERLKNHRKRREVFPQKYIRDNIQDAELLAPSVGEFRPLSRIIRCALFPYTRYKRTGVAEYYISCQDMTDEQYSLYIDTFKRVIDTIKTAKEEAK